MKKIMVVDDDESLSRFMGELLNGKGFETIVLTDSAEAIDKFMAVHDEISLVITDQTMPGMTGQELAKKIKTIDNSMPVILTTGYMGDLDSFEPSVDSVDVYLAKPVNIPEFLEVINKFLNAA